MQNDIKINTTQTRETQSSLSPQMGLERLMEGNARFVENKQASRSLPDQVQQTGSGQFPFAVVLGCIDSRVPAELVFDQGIGDIFNIRIAGNFVNDDILGSLEFACKAAGAKTIVVLGHTHCGAVKGACDNVQLGNLTGMLGKIMPAVDSVIDITEERNSGNAVFVQKVADSNVKMAIAAISDQRRSPVLAEMLDTKEIVVQGAMYDVETGKVEMLNS